MASDRPAEARDVLQHILTRNPDFKLAHREYAKVLASLGDFSRAAHHRREAAVSIYSLDAPYRGERSPIRVLALGSARGDCHTNVEDILDARIIRTTNMLVEYWDGKGPLPAHDIIFNIVADADQADASLDLVDWVLRKSTAQVINHPAAIRRTGRGEQSRRLAILPHVRAALTEQWPRARLNSTGAPGMLRSAGFTFPLLVRARGFNNGRHFVRVERAEHLENAVASLPGDDLLVIEMLDVRDGEGKIRKYRVIFVDRKPYPAHLAIGSSWKLHYYSAQMGEAERQIEKRFIDDMPGFLGERVMGALESIASTMALDYAGVDFGIDAAGRLALFEANATMNIARVKTDVSNAYRNEAFERIRDAVTSMVTERSRYKSQEISAEPTPAQIGRFPRC